MNDPDFAIDVHGVTKSFGGRVVVNSLDMQVRRGEIFGFLGPNGSGKTTFLRMLCGLLTPDAGEGRCLGFDFRRQSREIKRHSGYMPQHFSLYADLSIEENLDFIARVYGVPNRRAVVEAGLARLGLTAYRTQLAGTLSGGWKQRLALTACLIPQPKLLLLDEPTAGVDPKARRDFWDEIHLLSTEGITVLVTTHYMDEAERCHRLAYIARGNLLASGSIPDIIEDSRLSTWEISNGSHSLLEALRRASGVDQVVPFGSTLRVSGQNAEALQAGIRLTCANEELIRQVEPTLEDVFINLMPPAGDELRP